MTYIKLFFVEGIFDIQKVMYFESKKSFESLREELKTKFEKDSNGRVCFAIMGLKQVARLKRKGKIFNRI